jgi:CheY-like chemotaxis protein
MSATGTVLVVDDDVLVRDVVGRYLGRAGYQLTVAGDGEDALSAAEVSSPDLVVLDLMLPGLPGLDAHSYLEHRAGGGRRGGRGERASRAAAGPGHRAGADMETSVPYAGQHTLPFGDRLRALPIGVLWRAAP